MICFASKTILFVKFAFSLLILLAGSLITSCKSCRHEEVHSSEKLINCLTANRLSKEKEAEIRKKIHASQKAYSLDTLFSRKARVQGFNGAVIVAQQGVILYEAYFGYADMHKKDTLTPNSAFQLASVSKTFTGTGILMLAQENKLKLSDSVQQYIPGFPYHGVTIEHLLSHRSGLPNYLYCFEHLRKLNGPEPNNDSVISWFVNSDSVPGPFAPPGRNFSYNNTNFILLASIIEKVSKLSYPEFLKQYIFLPLGMDHTFVDTIAPDSLLRNRTTGHQGTRRREREFFDGVYGDKGIYSTARDMEKWYFALHSGCLLNKHWIQEAFTPRSLEKRSRHNYGLGFRLMTDPDNMNKVNYVYHGGWWAGYSTMLWMNMDEDIAVIVLGNRKNNSVYDIRPILELLEAPGKKPATDNPDEDE
jgi:CubicO group peptidase (beta-lactamase class C family)